MSSNPTAYLVAGVKHDAAITLEQPIPATVTRYDEITGVPYEKPLPLVRRLFKTIDAEGDNIYHALSQLGLDEFGGSFRDDDMYRRSVVGALIGDISYGDMFPCVGKGLRSLVVDQKFIDASIAKVQKILDDNNTGLKAELHIVVYA